MDKEVKKPVGAHAKEVPDSKNPKLSDKELEAQRKKYLKGDPNSVPLEGAESLMISRGYDPNLITFEEFCIEEGINPDDVLGK